jgi:prophage regulatory protein
MKILSFDDLRPAKGIAYSKVSLWRLEKRGEFPRRVRLGRGRHGWAEHEIDNWIADRIRARDNAATENTNAA